MKKMSDTPTVIWIVNYINHDYANKSVISAFSTMELAETYAANFISKLTTGTLYNGVSDRVKFSIGKLMSVRNYNGVIHLWRATHDEDKEDLIITSVCVDHKDDV